MAKRKSKRPSLFGLRPPRFRHKKNPYRAFKPAKPPAKRKVISRRTVMNLHIEEKSRKRQKELGRLEKQAAKERARIQERKLRRDEESQLRKWR